MLIRLLAAATLVFALSAETAQAQIYVWRDANGTLVLSDRNSYPGARTFAVPETPGFRVSRPPLSADVPQRYEPLIQTHSARYSVAPDLVRAVIQVESGFNPRARSSKGAMGLMQLMPDTARLMGVRDPYDADENIRGGASYLRQLLDRYDGKEELALAAYNAGPAAVEKYGQQIPPYAETRDYVKKVGSAVAKSGAAQRPRPAKRIIYKSVEIVDGQRVVRYSTEKPSGAYEIIR